MGNHGGGPLHPFERQRGAVAYYPRHGTEGVGFL